MQSSLVKVLENTEIRKDIFRLKVPYSGNPSPGQFVMISSHENQLLGRAISVNDYVDENLVLVYQKAGKETGALSRVPVGNEIRLTGPVGQGFPMSEYPENSKIALVGGGVGTAPLLYTARKLSDKGISTNAYLSFRSESMLKEEMAAFCHSVTVATEDGSEGVKGFVTNFFDPVKYDAVFCCGPTPMMEVVVKICENAKIPIYVSLENKMACGIGACLVCTCTKKDGSNHATCITGPVYSGEELDFHA